MTNLPITDPCVLMSLVQRSMQRIMQARPPTLLILCGKIRTLDDMVLCCVHRDICTDPCLPCLERSSPLTHGSPPSALNSTQGSSRKTLYIIQTYGRTSTELARIAAEWHTRIPIINSSLRRRSPLRGQAVLSSASGIWVTSSRDPLWLHGFCR